VTERYMVAFIKALPWWQRIHVAGDERVAGLLAVCQKGTRIIHKVCTEAKRKENASLTAKVRPRPALPAVGGRGSAVAQYHGVPVVQCCGATQWCSTVAPRQYSTTAPQHCSASVSRCHSTGGAMVPLGMAPQQRHPAEALQMCTAAGTAAAVQLQGMAGAVRVCNRRTL
jgi:hypothetical protein